jgi:hypothetical protein
VSTSPCAEHQMTADWYRTESSIRFRYEPGKRHLWNRQYANYRAQRRQKENQRALILSLVKDVSIPVAVVSVVAEAAEPETAARIEKRFRALAADWSENTRHISSVNDLISHSSYQEIIKLGWDVVPFLLLDLQQNKRFWFPALHAITKVRPFDPSDAGNSRRMTEAWVTWGKRKELI